MSTYLIDSDLELFQQLINLNPFIDKNIRDSFFVL